MKEGSLSREAIKLKPEGQIEVNLEEGASGGIGRRRHSSLTLLNLNVGKKMKWGEQGPGGRSGGSVLGSI